jgi:hypothetical protein
MEDHHQQHQQQRKQYLLRQQLLLSSRSLQLRQALISRGVTELQHTTTDPSSSSGNNKVPIDWECSLSTERHPKSCLYSFDAEIGTKVIAPLLPSSITTTTHDESSSSTKQKKKNQPPQYQWITLSSLNRLRRTDASKIEPLWHNQYSILSAWFTNHGLYSLYHHLTPTASLISYILDEPMVLFSSLIFLMIMSILFTLPLWEFILFRIVSSNSYLWRAWPHWSRFVHAALPLQLLMVQMTYRLIQSIFLSFYHTIRNQLIEYECSLFEQCIPLTIIES